MLKELMEKNRLNRWDRIMMAITFAEAGEFETAREIMDQRARKQQEAQLRKESERRPEVRL